MDNTPLDDVTSAYDSLADTASVGELEMITCEPDDASDYVDGVYITFEKLGQLVRRANSGPNKGHCSGCACEGAST